tara:strand:+ start:149 stop:490 length:342 start_codon:yes stop_codon:yes gene_type:complete
MNKTKINQLIEYLSPTIILSYFLFHNIVLVLIGMTLSLYLININMIDELIKSIKKTLINKKETREPNKHNNEIEYNSSNVKSTKEDTKITLVEAIEELGFIPSIDKKNDKNIA